MKVEDIYKKEINDLMIGRGCTKFHITGIRHCDFKDKADVFIRDAAHKMQNVILQREEANLYDPEAVICYSGNKQIGYVSTYDLEKFQILAKKDDANYLTGHFFFGNTGDHLLDLSVAGTITMDDIHDYRKEVDKLKKEQYGSWKHDAIKLNLVHSRHQDDAKACIRQMKDFTVKLFGGYGSTTQDELSPLLEQYKESSHYDISLEGQRDRWDILLYLDYLYDAWHKPYVIIDKEIENLLANVSSQIGGELGRSVSYTSYIERLTDLVTKHLPSSKPAQHYLNTLPAEAFNDIRLQVENFPHHLYHLFHTNPDEFVRTLYYARIPRRYLDPFLSGIALMEAYDKNKKVDVSIETPVSPQMKEDPKKQLTREEILDKLMGYASKGNWVKGIKVEDITSMLKTVLDTSKLIDQEHVNMSKILWDRLEHGRDGKSNRVDIVWANIVGYLKTKGFFSTINAAELSRDFFENKDQGGNINKGSYHQLDKVKSLLDAYLPKLPSKK